MRHTHRDTTPRTRHGGRRRHNAGPRPGYKPETWIPRLQDALHQQARHWNLHGWPA